MLYNLNNLLANNVSLNEIETPFSKQEIAELPNNKSLVQMALTMSSSRDVGLY